MLDKTGGKFGSWKSLASVFEIKTHQDEQHVWVISRPHYGREWRRRVSVLSVNPFVACKRLERKLMRPRCRLGSGQRLPIFSTFSKSLAREPPPPFSRARCQAFRPHIDVSRARLKLREGCESVRHPSLIFPIALRTGDLLVVPWGVQSSRPSAVRCDMRSKA